MVWSGQHFSTSGLSRRKTSSQISAAGVKTLEKKKKEEERVARLETVWKMVGERSRDLDDRKGLNADSWDINNTVNQIIQSGITFLFLYHQDYTVA